MRNLAFFPSLLFASIVSPAFADNEVIVGMASDLTPGFRCEVNQMFISDSLPLLRVTLNCTHEIDDPKVRELVSATFQGSQVLLFDRRTFDVWNEVRPQDQNFCTPSVEWMLDIVPPGFYMVF